MDVVIRNGVRIYDLTQNNTKLPEWLGDRAKRNLAKNDESIRTRIELIQDFNFPCSSTKLVQSNDGRYIIAAGTYPPRIRCFDTTELGMKFERYMNSDIVDICLLGGEDYGKLAVLQQDRTVSLHAAYGNHTSFRIPTFGRAIAYDGSTCDLIVAAVGTNVYRINLDVGTFQPSYELQTNDTISSNMASTCICIHPIRPMIAVGCSNGTIQLFDTRHDDEIRTPFCVLNVTDAVRNYGYSSNNPAAAMNDRSNEITCIEFNKTNEMYMIVGTGNGLAILYDIRTSQPVFVQEHKSGTPIHTVLFHGTNYIISSDETLIKIWSYTNKQQANSNNDDNDNVAVGNVLVNIESKSGKLNHCIISKSSTNASTTDSGIILATVDIPEMHAYYIPSIGVAPNWCNYLDTITDELEETTNTTTSANTTDTNTEIVFDKYKFVTNADLETLGITNLVGTPLLRGYMHGYFMDQQLYNRVKAVANPFEYEDYHKQKIKAKLAARSSSRILAASVSKKEKPVAVKRKVNPDLADRLQDKVDGGGDSKVAQTAKKLLQDGRFGRLFENPDYTINEEDEDFKLRNPSGVAALGKGTNKKRRSENMDSDDDASDNESTAKPHVEEGWGSNNSDNDDGSDDNDDEEDDGFRGSKVRGEEYESMKKLERQEKETKRKTQKKKKKKPSVVLQSGGDDDGIEALQQQHQRKKQHMPLSKRMEQEQGGSSSNSNSVTATGMQMVIDKNASEQQYSASTKIIDVKASSKTTSEVTYIPQADVTKRQQQEQVRGDYKKKRRDRRGVKELGLKKI